MHFLFRTITRSPIFLKRRCALTTVAVKQGLSPKYDAVQDLLKKHARLLRVVQRRIDERAKLRTALSDDMSSKEDISRLKHLKESEALDEAWTRWKAMREQLDETVSLLEDPDPTMHGMAAEEIDSLSSTLADMIENEFPKLLTPLSKTANLGALMELKSGVGGSESSLFLGELLRMYQNFANQNSWPSGVLSQNDLESGGIKDAIVEFKGEGAYDSLRWESGVHRVQRVPATEASGRTHTSTVAVVVLPLMEENDSGQDDLFPMDDIKLEVMRARGAGGQHVNKTESAVRLTHVPTGITVSMQDERSQHQNRRRAFQILRSRLMDIKLTQEMEERRSVRRNLVKSADRSEKIRTYNFSQDRVTDHRIGLTMKNLPSVMEGDGIQLFIEALKRDHAESIMEDMLEDSD